MAHRRTAMIEGPTRRDRAGPSAVVSVNAMAPGTAILPGAAGARLLALTPASAPAALAAVLLLALEAAGAEPSRFVGVAYLAVVTLPLCASDVRERLLPNTLVLPGYAFAAVGVVWRSASGDGGAGRGGAGGGGPPEALAGLVLCVLAVLIVLLAMADGGALGMGDVKLTGLLALVLGGLAVDSGVDAPVPVVACLAVAFGAAGVAALAAVPRRAPTADGIPLGPYLLGAFWAVGAVL